MNLRDLHTELQRDIFTAFRAMRWRMFSEIDNYDISDLAKKDLKDSFRSISNRAWADLKGNHFRNVRNYVSANNQNVNLTPPSELEVMFQQEAEEFKRNMK